MLVRCHAGCDVTAVIKAVGLELKDLFPPKNKKSQIVATYGYVDEEDTFGRERPRFRGHDRPRAEGGRRPEHCGRDLATS